MKIVTITEAEKIAGCRLDRRKKYATTEDGKPDEYFGGAILFEITRFTGTCSGCTDSEDGHMIGTYSFDEKAGCHIGSGCDECGYTGKRREEMWVPAA